MLRKTAVAVVVATCGACDEGPETVSTGFCDMEGRDAVAAVVDAHGGMDAWQKLSTLYVEREHRFTGSETPIRFSIHAEYPSHRIYQTWQEPAGTLAWDGERAWSSGWPLADQLMPRYVAGIGFYLVNMPWLVFQDSGELATHGCTGTLPGHGEQKFLLITASYEPDPVRKPGWYTGPRDTYELYVDPDSHRLSGIMQHWTYAGRLDTAGVPASVHAISQLFVPDTFIEVNGLVWPHTYKAYTTGNEIAAEGRFFDYDFSRPLDEEWFFPDDSESIKPDTSSSYHRHGE